MDLVKVLSELTGFYGVGFFFLGFSLFLLLSYFQLNILGLTVFAFGFLAWIFPQYWYLCLTVLILSPTPFRIYLLSVPLMKVLLKMKLLPKISATEKEALESGDVWIEKELYKSKPDFKKLFEKAYVPKLTEKEKAFLDGPVNEFLEMCDEYSIWSQRQFPKEALEFIKKNNFFGIIIPEKWGGLGFSNYAHSCIIKKIGSRSMVGSINVMVPNSLGPAELLNHYGTEKQKAHYLPRLAAGEEVPCFALTEPTAGSDATSIQAEGIVLKKSDGRLYVRLNMEKRWISLAGIATLVGAAFQLKDPENYLEQGENIGITCALISKDTPGLTLDRCHNPMSLPFSNSPIFGKDVEFDLEECVIGGKAGCGQGWGMLMDCLGAGRGISLPSQAQGSLQHVSHVAFNHAYLRKQFGVSLDRFEGVQEPLTRLWRRLYISESVRNYTLSSLDQGVKSAVISATSKYYLTELARASVVDAMDILGGKGISMGSKNSVVLHFISSPIGITVEGANILTRTLIIFGQGVLRAHSYLKDEVEALENSNKAAFDKAVWGHAFSFLTSFSRWFIMTLTQVRLVMTPSGYGYLSPYLRRLTLASSFYSYIVDLSLFIMGGSLKLKEHHSGRLADAFTHLYAISSVIKRYKEEGLKKEEWPLVKYCLEYEFYELKRAFRHIVINFPWPLAFVVRRWHSVVVSVLPLGSGVNDKMKNEVCSLLRQDSKLRRHHFTNGNFMSQSDKDFYRFQEEAFRLNSQTEKLEKKALIWLKSQNKKSKSIGTVDKSMKDVVSEGILSQEEMDLVNKAQMMRLKAIQVDDFSERELRQGVSSFQSYAESSSQEVS